MSSRRRASDVLLLAYTSGTTGRPKGAVHTHAGFLVKVASEVAYGFELAPGRTFCWITDMGWIMGPLSIIGTHANGGTLLLYEGSPDVPGHRPAVAARRASSACRCSASRPTLIRTLRAAGNDPRRPTCRRFASSARPVSPGTRSRTSGWPATCSAGGCRSSTSPAAPRWVGRSCAVPGRGHPQLLAGRAGAGHGRRRGRRRRAAAARQRRRAGLPAAVAVDDARGVEGRRALPGGVLVDVPRPVAARRLRAGRRGPAGTSSAARTT